MIKNSVTVNSHSQLYITMFYSTPGYYTTTLKVNVDVEILPIAYVAYYLVNIGSETYSCSFLFISNTPQLFIYSLFYHALSLSIPRFYNTSLTIFLY